MSLPIVAQERRVFLSKNHGLARGWPEVNPFTSGCAYGWVETSTLLSSSFTIWVSNKYFHTLYNGMEMMVECLCLWLTFTVFDKSLEMLIILL